MLGLLIVRYRTLGRVGGMTIPVVRAGRVRGLMVSLLPLPLYHCTNTPKYRLYNPSKFYPIPSHTNKPLDDSRGL